MDWVGASGPLADEDVEELRSERSIKGLKVSGRFFTSTWQVPQLQQLPGLTLSMLFAATVARRDWTADGWWKLGRHWESCFAFEVGWTLFEATRTCNGRYCPVFLAFTNSEIDKYRDAHLWKERRFASFPLCFTISRFSDSPKILVSSKSTYASQRIITRRRFCKENCDRFASHFCKLTCYIFAQ